MIFASFELSICMLLFKKDIPYINKAKQQNDTTLNMILYYRSQNSKLEIIISKRDEVGQDFKSSEKKF